VALLLARFALAFACLALNSDFSAAEEIRVPAFTAYMLPDVDSARTSEQRGVTRWTDPKQSVNWYGKFACGGELAVIVEMRLQTDATSRLKLTIGEQSCEATVAGKGKDGLVQADFGLFKIAGEGHQRFTLVSLNDGGKPAGDLDALVLSGSALAEAHFNVKERRNAASVHLMGVENGQFFLSHGGFLDGFTKYGEKFTRAPSAQRPQVLDLPPIPN